MKNFLITESEIKLRHSHYNKHRVYLLYPRCWFIKIFPPCVNEITLMCVKHTQSITNNVIFCIYMYICKHVYTLYIAHEKKNSIHIHRYITTERLDLEYRLMNSYGIRIQKVLHCVVSWILYFISNKVFFGDSIRCKRDTGNPSLVWQC